MLTLTWDKVGKVAYVGYCSMISHPMPEWRLLPEEIQSNWIKAAKGSYRTVSNFAMSKDAVSFPSLKS